MHCFDDVEKKSLDRHHQKGGEGVILLVFVSCLLM